MAGSDRSGKRGKGSVQRKGGVYRAKRAGREPYRWLGAGAVSLGMGMALASGTGIAHADSTASDSSLLANRQPQHCLVR